MSAIVRCITFLILSAVCGESTSSIPEAAEPLKPSHLLASADVYDGQQIQAAGLLYFDVEARQLWDSKKAMNAGASWRDCLTLVGTRRFLATLSALSRREVVIEGIYRAHIYAGKKVIDLGMCNDAGIEVLNVRGADAADR